MFCITNEKRNDEKWRSVSVHKHNLNYALNCQLNCHFLTNSLYKKIDEAIIITMWVAELSHLRNFPMHHAVVSPIARVELAITCRKSRTRTWHREDTISLVLSYRNINGANIELLFAFLWGKRYPRWLWQQWTSHAESSELYFIEFHLLLSATGNCSGTPQLQT